MKSNRERLAQPDPIQPERKLTPSGNPSPTIPGIPQPVQPKTVPVRQPSPIIPPVKRDYDTPKKK
jgi:hypothetical protein